MAQLHDITQLLLSTQNADGNIRQQAEHQLKLFQQQDGQKYVLSLSAELANDAKPNESRRMAGIILKNTLYAKEATTQEELRNAWASIPGDIRSQIKQALLRTLAAQDPNVANTAALVIAQVAAVDYLNDEWKELVPTLLQGVKNDVSPVGLKVASLEALGYTCEELGNKTDTIPQEDVNSILTAVVAGMGSAEANSDVRLAATKALRNAIDFASNNFELDAERDYIMRMVCEAAAAPDLRVRSVAMECLDAIGTMYYEKLAPYMDAIWTLTNQAMQDWLSKPLDWEDESKEGLEDVVMKAIEFWTSLSEEELERQEELEEAPNSGLSLNYFVQNACQHLVGLLLQLASRQDEHEDEEEDDWTPAMAAGLCLCQIAECVKDSVVDTVMQFVQANVQNQENWRLRDAALFAFGAIMIGPSPEKLSPLVKEALGFLLLSLQSDQHSHVRSTTAWTLGRIFIFLNAHQLQRRLLSPEQLSNVVQTLLGRLNEAPHIASQIVGALNQLAEGYSIYDATEAEQQTNPLSPMLQTIIMRLLQQVDRNEPHTQNLHVDAYETICACVDAAAWDCAQMVAELIPEVLRRLGGTFTMTIANAEALQKQQDMQSQLCSVLAQIIKRLAMRLPPDNTTPGVALVKPYQDHIMQAVLQVISSRPEQVNGEALLVLVPLTQVAGESFEVYMDHFYPCLEAALKNFRDTTTCNLAVGLVSDISAALHVKLAKWSDKLMQVLLEDLTNDQIGRSVKPHILEVFGDICLNMEQENQPNPFEQYVPSVTQVLLEAMNISERQRQECMSDPDEEVADYNNDLRFGIFQASAGMVQGLHKDQARRSLPNFAQQLLQFVALIAEDKELSEIVVESALNVMGDIASIMTDMVPQMVADANQRRFLAQLVQQGRTYDNQKLSQAAAWAIKSFNDAGVSLM